MDLPAYYRERRTTRLKLLDQFPEGTCYLTSIANRDRGIVPNSVCIADLNTASRCLVENTHRVSTADEIAAFNDHQERNRRISAVQEDRINKQTFVLLKDSR
jgi:hypothetical protein